MVVIQAMEVSQTVEDVQVMEAMDMMGTEEKVDTYTTNLDKSMVTSLLNLLNHQ